MSVRLSDRRALRIGRTPSARESRCSSENGHRLGLGEVWPLGGDGYHSRATSDPPDVSTASSASPSNVSLDPPEADPVTACEAFTVALAPPERLSAIPKADTRPELVLRAAMRRAGTVGYRCHLRRVPGSPDVAFTRWRLAVFVDGVWLESNSPSGVARGRRGRTKAAPRGGSRIPACPGRAARLGGAGMGLAPLGARERFSPRSAPAQR